MRKLRIAFFLFAALTLARSTSRAAILLSQPQVIGIEQYPSSGDAPNTADDFVPTANWLVGSAEVFGVWPLGGAELGTDDSTRQFRVEFYADQNGSLATTPIAQFYLTVPMLQTVSNVAIPFGGLFDINILFPAAVPLAAAQTYWFSVADIGPGSDTSFFVLASSFDGNHRIAQRSAIRPWTVYYNTNDVAFNLLGEVVPEPTTLGMLAFVTVGLFARRRTK